MENRKVGFLVIGMSALIGIIVFLFNTALSDIVNVTCQHGASCPMWHSIRFHTNLSLILMAFPLTIGLYLVFSEQLDQFLFKIPQTGTKKITKQSYKNILKGMNSDEQKVFEKIIEAQGSIFQSKIIENTEFNKVKVTRILDNLEGKGLLERRRRGMSNVVILKK